MNFSIKFFTFQPCYSRGVVWTLHSQWIVQGLMHPNTDVGIFSVICHLSYHRVKFYRPFTPWSCVPIKLSHFLFFWKNNIVYISSYFGKTMYDLHFLLILVKQCRICIKVLHNNIMIGSPTMNISLYTSWSPSQRAWAIKEYALHHVCFLLWRHFCLSFQGFTSASMEDT